MDKPRALLANEIECRVQSLQKNGTACILFLYKDARCDMNILDETFGIGYWKREHQVINGVMYCGISVYNKDIDEWVVRWDAGTKSMTEGEKGEASDSFKRAGTNWGIGRELYASPFIWINLNQDESYSVKDRKTDKEVWKLSTKVKFQVSSVRVSEGVDRRIEELEIVDQNGVLRFSTKQRVQAPVTNHKNGSVVFLKRTEVMNRLKNVFNDVDKIKEFAQKNGLKSDQITADEMLRIEEQFANYITPDYASN